MDTIFVRAETPSVLLHVTGVMVLDPGPTTPTEVRDRVRRLVSARLDSMAPLRWRLVEPPGGMGALRWVEDPAFDVDRHVQLGVVRSPGSREDLEHFVAEVAATPIDRQRPLWEMHVVGGLEDGSVALVSKFHHAFMDGGAGMEMLAALFDLTPDIEPSADDGAHRAEVVPGGWRLLVDTPRDVINRLSQIPAAVVGTVSGIGGLLGAMFPSRGPTGSGPLAPRSPFNGALTHSRVVALADCSLDDVKAVKTAFGVTVNDVVLAAVTSSLRAELVDGSDLGDAPVERGPLVAAVPISVRDPSIDEPFGNHTSAMMVPLPTDVDEPVERLRAVHRCSAETKQRHHDMAPDLIERWAGLVPPWMISGGAGLFSRLGVSGRLPPVFNLIVSNVAGPPVPIYVAGCEVTATYPLGPLLDGSGLNITVMSQCDRLHIGLIGDPTIVRHADRVARGVGEGVAELLRAASRAEEDPPAAG